MQPELRLLIVDDSPEDQELYMRLLRSGAITYAIATAESGEEGLAKLQADTIECILLDYNLPDMNGLEFLHEISNGNGGAPAAVVMLTGQGNEAIAVEAMKQGAHDYIVKNALTLERLAHSIQGAVEKVTLHHELKKANDQIERLAFYDPLTGVANRNLFRDRIEQSIRLGKRFKEKFGFLLLDLDQFKEVNDTMGHLAGDRLLQEFTQRLKSCVRESDTIARLGGDEFAIILENMNNTLAPDAVANKIIDQCTHSIKLQGKEVKISCSIGISVFPDDAENFDGLLMNADTAMYRAKDGGRNGFRFFTPEMNEQATYRKNLQMDLEQALDNGEFEIYYQPIVDLKEMRLQCAEALLRWSHPKRGSVSPAEFIPVAEETRLIVPIGEWVFRAVCQQVKIWKENNLHPPRVAVNLSSWQLQQEDFLDVVKRILENTKADPKWFSMEITESVLMDEDDHGVTTLENLRKMGIYIALDDFGTGYSSLGYLRSLPIDIIKIDRSFIQDIPSNLDEMAITEAIIAMSHRLGLKAVAEGIETDEQLEFLHSTNCDYGQGFYFGKATAAKEFEETLRSYHASAFSRNPTFG